MPVMRKCAAVILAGGRSQRMGVDKSTLTYQKVPLLLYMQSLLIESGFAKQDIYVSNKQNIADIYPALGPVGGIYSCIKYLCTKYDELLFVAVDMPKLSPQLLHLLRSYKMTDQVLRFDNYYLPCKIQTSDKIITILENICCSQSGNDKSLKYFQNKAGVQKITDVMQYDKSLFANLNTIEEYQQALQQNK